MQFLTYFNTLGHLETWDPLQQLSAWQWDTAAGSQVFRLTHGSTKTQVTDYNFQGICQAISSIQTNHHLYHFYLEIVHIISKRSNGQVSKLFIGTDLHCSFLALLGCTSWRTPQMRESSVCDWWQTMTWVAVQGSSLLAHQPAVFRRKVSSSTHPPKLQQPQRTKSFIKGDLWHTFINSTTKCNLTTNTDLTLLKLFHIHKNT